MARAFLRANAELIFSGEPYLVERQCTDGVWVLRHTLTGRQLEQSTTQIFDAYSKGSAIFKNKDVKNISLLKSRNSRELASSGADLDAAKIRMAYVRAVVGLPRSRKCIEKAIDEVWEKLDRKPAKKPNWSTVYRWVRAYVASGETPISLMSAHADKGNREARFSSDVIEICKDVIADVYLSAERPTVEHAVEIAKAKTRLFNKMLPQSFQLVMPTRRLMQRLIDETPAYDAHVARYGREAARKKFRTSLKHRLTEAPLQRGEIDHTRMDVFVVDEVSGLPLGRPWLTILVDDFTRCVLGYCLSFEPPSRATVARCLRHAFLPKTNLRMDCPDVKNEWIPFGVIAEIVLDGGTEFHSAELENICFELNIEQHFSPRKTPWFKGKVERFQGTLNRAIAITTPGKTFEGIVDRDDYDPKKHAIVTMSLLRNITIRWIVDVYHQKPHHSLGCSPAQMWVSHVRPHDIPLMADPLRFDAIVGGADTRVLSHKGIEFSGLLYNSPEMGDLRRRFGERLTVDVRLDRSNLGSVIVLHPERGTPYRVPCLRQDYAEGLTDWQHTVCKRYARDRLQGTDDVDDWLDSLLEISDLVRKELNLGKRKGATRERMARWTEGKQLVPEHPVEIIVEQPTGAFEPQTTKPQKAPLEASPIVTAPSSVVSTIVRKRFTPVFEERKQMQVGQDASQGNGIIHE